MSVFKVEGSPFYQYEFKIKRRRFRGTTGTANRKEALAVEAAKREQAKKEVAAASTSAVSLRLEDIISMYWHEKGQHLAGEGADNCFRDLARLNDYFGPDKLITEITNADVAKLVAWRRGHRVARYRKIKGKMVRDKDAPLIAPATVNRSCTELLKKLFMRCRDVWSVRFEQWPIWKEHMLPEPEERVRELHDGEEVRIMDATRDDYAPLIEFSRMTGLRATEVRTLEWRHVNWGTRQIVRLGKGGKRVSTPITDEVRELLWPLQGHHESRVFTYICKRTTLDDETGEPVLIKGQRYPITKEGLKSAWRRVRAKAGVAGEGGFRFHDFRHDLATKTLRATGNMKLVQRMLNHSNLSTTAKYAHVIDDEVAAALQASAQGRVRKAASPQKSPQTDVCPALMCMEDQAKSA